MKKDRRHNDLYLFAALGLILLLTLLLLLVRIAAMSAGLALRIECARLIIDGATPYRDFLVLDQPVAILLAWFPVAIAHFGGMHSGYAAAVATTVWNWGFSVTSIAILFSLPAPNAVARNSMRWQGFVVLFAILNLLSVYQFGEPEHLLMLGAVPYAVGRWLEYRGSKLLWWQTTLTGVCGGVVCALDPLFICLPILLEVCLATLSAKLSARFFSSFTVAIGTICLIAASLFLFASDSFSLYLKYMWPLVEYHREMLTSQRTYSFDATPDGRPIIYFLIGTTVLYLALPKGDRLNSLMQILAWLGLVSYAAQGEGFSYQIVPLFWCSCCSIYLSGMHLWLTLARQFNVSARKKVFCPWVAIIVFAGGALIKQQHDEAFVMSDKIPRWAIGESEPETAAELLSGTSTGDTILTLTADLRPLYPLITLSERRPQPALVTGSLLDELLSLEKIHAIAALDADKFRDYYFKVFDKSLAKNPPKAIFISQDLDLPHRRPKLHEFIMSNYKFVRATHFYSNNFPPKEYSSLNYDINFWRRK